MTLPQVCVHFEDAVPHFRFGGLLAIRATIAGIALTARDLGHVVCCMPLFCSQSRDDGGNFLSIAYSTGRSEARPIEV
jgi:hypothetical protein